MKNRTPHITTVVFALVAFSLFGCASTPPLPTEPAPEIGADSCRNRTRARVAPQYPREALNTRQSGWVVAIVNYSAEGKVVSVKPVQASPPGIFENVTEVALSKWLMNANGTAGSCKQLMEYALRK